MLLTQDQIENKIVNANLRREHTSVEAQIKRISPRMNRSMNQVTRHSMLSQQAGKRQSYEEAIFNECQQNIKRIEASQTRQSMIAEVDEQSERDEQSGLMAAA